MMETSAKNTQAILELRHEIAGRVVIKTTVDDIKTRQPSRMPRKVMKAYLNYMDISAEMLDDQMDWECWPVDEELEEFDFDIPSESSPTL